MILIFLAPESPWLLVRNGRKEQALRSIERLGSKTKEHAHQSLAVIERTSEIEALHGGSPTLLDLFKGTDLRRTTIICLMYASENFGGNLIANQATFFFEREYIPSDNFQVQVTDFSLRSRNLAQPFFPAQSDQLVSPIYRQCRLLVAHEVVWLSNDLSLGHSRQHHSARYSRDLRLRPTEPSDQLCPGHPRYPHLFRFCWRNGANLIHRHRRDVLSPSSRFEHCGRSCRLLRRGNSHDLSGIEDARPDRIEPRRQVRLCLGRYCPRLLGDGVLLSS